MKVAELEGAELSKSEKCRIASTTHGMRWTRTYNIWMRMKDRCTNQHSEKWAYYGGRGIRVCDRWMLFENFFADMGESPDGNSIDRIDNDGDYEPGNCRWATMKTQTRNRRSNLNVSFNGKTMCLKDWSAEIGIPYKTLWMRFKDGWSVERILTQSLRKQKGGGVSASKFGDSVPDEIGKGS